MKRINPRRKPVTQADLNKAREEAIHEGSRAVAAIFLRVMKDKEGYGIKRLTRLWNEVSDYSDALGSGEIKIKDVIKSLEEEDGIII